MLVIQNYDLIPMIINNNQKILLDLVIDYFSFQAVNLESAIHDQGRYFYSFITKGGGLRKRATISRKVLKVVNSSFKYIFFKKVKTRLRIDI